MNTSNAPTTSASRGGFRNSLIGRSLLVVPLGFFLGQRFDLTFLRDTSPWYVMAKVELISPGLYDVLARMQNGNSCPVIGSMAGVIVAILICTVTAERVVPSFVRFAARGAVLGVLVAVLLATVVYPEFGARKAQENAGKSGRVIMPTAWPGVYHSYVLEGSRYGVPMGVFLGGIGGMWVHLWQSQRQHEESPTP